MSDDANDEGTAADKSLSVNTARLEAIAKAAQSRADARKWRSQKDGTLGLGEPLEVRSLTTDETAKAEAEASMQRLMEKQKQRGSTKGRRY
jgi:hypothetical protein